MFIAGSMADSNRDKRQRKEDVNSLSWTKWGSMAAAGPKSQQAVYAWIDGVCEETRLAKDRAAILVAFGAHSDGADVLIGVSFGYRQSA